MPGNYIVQYDPNFPTGPWTTLDDVQEISFSGGRRHQLDAYNASTIRVTARYPTGFASPITALVPGTSVQILSPNIGAYPNGIGGKIRNVNVNYGIPYKSNVGEADMIEIDIEGGFAEVGRMAGNSFSMPSATFSNQMTTLNAQTGLNVTVALAGSNPTMAATTVNSTWGDWVNSSLVSINGRMSDFGGAGSIVFKSPYVTGICSVNFSDVVNNATHQVYDALRFDALADNFYTQVQVVPQTVAQQTVLGFGTPLPYRTLTINTLNATSSQAEDLATFLLSQYNTQKFAISQISCKAEAQNSFQLDKLGLSGMAEMIGARVNVAFRGTTFVCLIEGVSLTATPDGARYTYNVSGADLNNYLILNDAVFGKLNNNKLGY